MMRQYELVEKVAAYDPNVNEELLNRAYVFSMRAHGSQTRASGDPYFSHPLEVAGILTDYKLDCATIVTALLHDTVEDTVATHAQIEDGFGPQIARLVDGVTKLSKLELRSEASSQAENFRKLVLAMSDDIRVLLVKLADRLHNMRTIRHLQAGKRTRIAAETMDIYAPLAERIGMHRIKEELEDLSFAELHPDARASVQKRLDFLRAAAGDVVPRITEELRRTVTDGGLAATVSGREKKPYSIWRKMQRDNVSFEQLSDIVAFRVIVDDVADCYQALGIVHGQYSMVPDRFKDYISTPKRNNYRSIHTTVIGPENQRIEIQIRTHEMHDIAELGVAAHWRYKQDLAASDGSEYRWLQGLREILEHEGTAEEFLEHTKLEMFQDQVFCFTPKGDVIALPRGATPVDFAYAVHSEVGDTCVGARVNGRVMPLRTRLTNGDQVDILRSNAGTPDPAWENIVVTGKARSAIRRFIRHQARDEYRQLGEAIADKAFRQAGHEFSEKAIDGALKVLKAKSAADVYVALGDGHLTSKELMSRIFPGEQRRWGARDAIGAINQLLPSRLRRHGGGRDLNNAVPISGLIPGMAVHYATCCHPLPGDRIVGIITKGKGVMIHTIDCEQLESHSDTPEQWLDVKWEIDPDNPGLHVGQISTVVANAPGSLSNLSTVIAKNMGNISNLRITNRSPDFFEMKVDIEVADVKHLANIMAALRATPSVSSVERDRG